MKNYISYSKIYIILFMLIINLKIHLILIAYKYIKYNC